MNFFKLKQRGQYFALIALIGGVTCILYGFEISGSIVSGVGLSGLVSEFLGRRRNQHQASTDKNQ